MTDHNTVEANSITYIHLRAEQKLQKEYLNGISEKLTKKGMNSKVDKTLKKCENFH